VAEPVELECDVDPGVAGATVSLNGVEAGEAPARVVLDLCSDNEIQVRAEGYYPATLTLAAGATPLEARTALGGLVLDPIPLGRLVLPATRTPVQFLVDGKRVQRTDEGIELPAGEHRIRAVNRKYWVDVTSTVQVPAGGKIEAEVDVPALAVLAVQAFPSNCKVYLRRPRGPWKLWDTTPARRRIATGRYEVRVEFVPTGETREQTVDVRPGSSSPLRFSFARSKR
jgi:hypothetical protein